MGSLKDDLCTPGVKLVETHISWVFLSERDVWKVKKPVSLGFLDFSTPRARLKACAAEVALNRRLAPDVYHGVVRVTRDPSGNHEFEGYGTVVDWAVHMARLPARDRCDSRLATNRLSPNHVDDLARRLAAFHETTACSEEIAQFGTPDVVRRNVEENFDQTRESIRAHLSPEEFHEIERWQLNFLQENGDLFDRRARRCRVRDGHGDLRLEHVYIDDIGRVVIIDCIEFNERFRYADVCADIAFLSMDLAWHGRGDLAERLLATYAREANDFDLYPLVDFYEGYRAFVRGKVASILFADPSIDWPAKRRAQEEARRYYLLALASERRPMVPPVVVAVGGVIGTGKSTIADWISGEISAPVVDADRTRKFMLGVPPTQNVAEAGWQGAYERNFSDRVYAELLRRADMVLASGRPVVIDASFRTRALRARAAHLARDRGVPFLFVECRADADVCRERLRQREGKQSVSDGRLEIFDDFAAAFEPVVELSSKEHVVLDTVRPAHDNHRALRARIVAWPAGMTQ